MRNEQMNPDVAIDRVLNGLACVEAPAEIEQRVLRAAQQRAAERGRPRFAGLSALTQWPPWAVAACVVLLSFTASVAVRKRHEPRREEAVLNQHVSPTPTPSIGIPEARTERQPVLAASAHRNAAKQEVPSAEESLAISEMNAPSKPAPPLPLTHQEKLLAEAVHQDGTNNLSSLRPEVRDKQMELSKTDFHDFFEPPPSKDNE